MIKEFIPYEQALALKELGFNESCLRVGNPNGHTMWKWIEVDKDNETISVNDILNVEYMEVYIQIPTFSQAFRFFREKYNLIGLVEGGYDNGKNIFTYVIWEGFKDIIIDDYYNTYEEAELACLNKLIEITKNK